MHRIDAINFMLEGLLILHTSNVSEEINFWYGIDDKGFYSVHHSKKKYAHEIVGHVLHYDSDYRIYDPITDKVYDYCEWQKKQKVTPARKQQLVQFCTVILKKERDNYRMEVFKLKKFQDKFYGIKSKLTALNKEFSEAVAVMMSAEKADSWHLTIKRLKDFLDKDKEKNV